jgi:hypothetical protein
VDSNIKEIGLVLDYKAKSALCDLGLHWKEFYYYDEIRITTTYSSTSFGNGPYNDLKNLFGLPWSFMVQLGTNEASVCIRPILAIKL